MFKVIQRREEDKDGVSFYWLKIDGFGITTEIQVSKGRFDDSPVGTKLELARER